MAPKKVCQVCQILKYQDLAARAKYRYQVARYLKLAQAARTKILNIPDLKYCKLEHEHMAEDMKYKHEKVIEQLRTINKKTTDELFSIMAELAFNSALATITHGIGSIESMVAREELESTKRKLSARKRKIVEWVV